MSNLSFLEISLNSSEDSINRNEKSHKNSDQNSFLNISLCSSISIESNYIDDDIQTSVFSSGNKIKYGKFNQIMTNLTFRPLEDVRQKEEHVKRILKHSLQYSSSYKSMESMSNVVNLTPNASIKVPCTQYTIKKFVDPVFLIYNHISCLSCGNYTESSTNETSCSEYFKTLKTSQSEYFVTIPRVS